MISSVIRVLCRRQLKIFIRERFMETLLYVSADIESHKWKQYWKLSKNNRRARDEVIFRVKNHEHSGSMMMKFHTIFWRELVRTIIGFPLWYFRNFLCLPLRLRHRWEILTTMISLLSTNALQTTEMKSQGALSTFSLLSWNSDTFRRCASTDVSNEIKSIFTENSKNKSALAYVCVHD